MRAVRRSEHNTYQIHYHFVIPVKYRLSIFGRSEREQTLIQICTEIEERYDWVFEQMGIDRNHVHLLISAAPKYSPSEIIRGIKSITAKELFRRHPDLRDELWHGDLIEQSSFGDGEENRLNRNTGVPVHSDSGPNNLHIKNLGYLLC